MSSAQFTGKGLARGPAEFNGVKIFSATLANDRDQLGEKVTAWMRANPHLRVTDTVVSQSSDAAFHCLAISVFYWEELPTP